MTPWMTELSTAYLQAIARHPTGVSPAALALELGAPEPSVVHWLGEMAREGLVTITGTTATATPTALRKDP